MHEERTVGEDPDHGIAKEGTHGFARMLPGCNQNTIFRWLFPASYFQTGNVIAQLSFACDLSADVNGLRIALNNSLQHS